MTTREADLESAEGRSSKEGPTRRLADFIRSHHEAILREWESFARTLLPAAQGMSKAGLRDHADEILTAIVGDMESLQTVSQTIAKSKGHKPKDPWVAGHPGALGRVHALLRIESGFTLAQVVAEYRALRASVFRLWQDDPTSDPAGVLRFNESIDEALAEAVDRYTAKTDEYRDQLIGIVSHDLRNPLGGILMGSSALSGAEGLDDKSSRIASSIQNSAKRMVRIVSDLLDLTRTRLGSEIPVVRGAMDLGATCRMVISELEGGHPNAVIQFATEGDLRGDWDSDRLAQVLSNLVGNALQHGDARKPIKVAARGDHDEVVLTISNEGPPILESALRDVFEPMVRSQSADKRSTGLGLGLFIARELVTAHAGQIDVTSSAASGTTFTVRLPRRFSSPEA